MLTQPVIQRESTPFARVEVLDQFRIVMHGHEVPVSDSGARLVACLALGDRPRTRPSLATTLWADRSETDAQASLRRTLWRLNEVAEGLVERSGHRLALAEDVTVDAREVMVLADDVANGRQPIRTNSDAVRLLQGELLPSWSDDWLDGSRESMPQARLHTLEALARKHRFMGFGHRVYKAGDPRTRSIMARTRTIVIPVVNPDGFNTSREAGEAAGGGTGRGGEGDDPLRRLRRPREGADGRRGRRRGLRRRRQGDLRRPGWAGGCRILEANVRAKSCR